MIARALGRPALAALLLAAPAAAEEGHGHSAGHDHSSHAHTAEPMDHAEQDRALAAMAGLGLTLPRLDPAEGRALFLSRGCVACHSAGGVGGRIGPSLDAAEQPRPVSLLAFAARMWSAAPAMTQMQQDMLGEPVTLTAEELGHLTAFVQDEAAQAALTPDDVPEEYRALIAE